MIDQGHIDRPGRLNDKLRLRGETECLMGHRGPDSVCPRQVAVHDWHVLGHLWQFCTYNTTTGRTDHMT
jgi:hypothetical protein